MTTAKAVPSNGQTKEGKEAVVLPDLPAIRGRLDRVQVRTKHDAACEYVHEAHRLIYAMQWHSHDITDALRREWLYAAAGFAARAAEFAYDAAALLTPLPGEADDDPPC